MPRRLTFTATAGRLRDLVLLSRPVRRLFRMLQGDSIHRMMFGREQDSDCLKGVAIDYGCGRGDFIKELCRENVRIIAADTSEGVLRGVKEQFSDKVAQTILIEQPPLKVEGGVADYIFFNAVVEHLLPDMLDRTLKEFSRLLKKGGHVVVTTSNRENLAKYKTICPDCGGKFHYMQHVGSYSEDTLRKLMEKYGFVTIATECSWLDDDRTIEGRIKNTYHWLKEKLGRGKKLPNLTYIGQAQ
jgi:SAM-dependent methyltransferase